MHIRNGEYAAETEGKHRSDPPALFMYLHPPSLLFMIAVIPSAFACFHVKAVQTTRFYFSFSIRVSADADEMILKAGMDRNAKVR